MPGRLVETTSREALRRAYADMPRRSSGEVTSRSARPPQRRLFRPTTPVAGESLRGLVARACARNFVPNSWGVLKYLGLPNRNRVLVSEDPNIKPSQLAYALRTHEEEIVSRRYEPMGANHFLFFGLDLHGSAIETRLRRFSPTSLIELPIHRAVWELRDLPFCPFGWDILQDRCHCEGENGIIQGWTRTLSGVECCDQCGDPLSRLASIPVPEHMRRDLSLLLTLVGSTDEERGLGLALPEKLARMDRSRLFKIVCRLAQAISEEPEYDREDPESCLTRCENLRAACRAMIEWPTGIHDIKPAAHFSPAAWSRLVTAYVSCGYGSNETSSATSAQDGPVGDASAFELLGMRPAAVESGIKDETLEEFWKAGVFTKHRRAHGDRMLPAVERGELMEFAARWHDRIKSETFAYQLGISHHGVEQLIALGMVSATAPALPGQPLSLTSSEAAGFVEQVRSNAMSSIPCSIPLREAALVIGGRLKPWGPIFAALLDQTIPYTVSEDGASLLDRIAIQEADAGLLSTLRFDRDDHPDFQFADRMMQNDALATLNTTKRSAAILAGLKTQGVNPKTYALTDVEKRAAKVMTLAEIGAVLQLDIVSTRHRLKNVGLQPLLAGAYDRSFVEPYLEVIAKLGAPGRNRTRAKRQFERFMMRNTAEKSENDAAQSRAYVKNSL